MGTLGGLYKIVILLCPVFSSLFAIIILFFDIGSSPRKPLKLHRYLLAYFFSVFLSWVSAILYFYAPLVFVYINSVSMLAVTLIQVLYYGFFFEVTRTSTHEKFSNFNYLVPVLLSLLLLVVSLNIPFQDQVNTIRAKGVYQGGSKLFFYLNYSKISFRLALDLVYTVLAFRRLLRYHRLISNFSSNEEKVSLRWVSTLLFFSMLLGLGPLLKLLESRDEMVYSPIAIFFVIALLCQYAYIVLHVIKRDRFIIDFSTETKSNHFEASPPVELNTANSGNVFLAKIEPAIEVVDNEAGGSSFPVTEVVEVTGGKTVENELSPYLKKNVLNRESFEAFIKVEKPYLNADLKITDLVDMLHVNRTYISSFINKEFGVNFSVLINKYRLLEYENLKTMPEYSKMNKSELAEMAGFNSYRSFQRTEKEFSVKTKKRFPGINVF